MSKRTRLRPVRYDHCAHTLQNAAGMTEEHRGAGRIFGTGARARLGVYGVNGAL